MISRFKHSLVVSAAFLSCSLSPFAAAADWSAAKAKDIALFYPGQAAWEFVLVPSTHKGAKPFREGKSCRECHEGEEADMGEIIVSGEKLEPDPIKGMPGHLMANVAFALENDTLMMKVSWAEQEGGPFGKADAMARVSLMIGDDSVKESVRAGCWGACHTDVKTMPDDAGIGKYLAASRTKLTRNGGGENYKPDGDIASLQEGGQFLEIWMAELNGDAPAMVKTSSVLKDFELTATDKVSAESSFSDGVWTVTLSRKLKSDDGHELVQGAVVPVGFAIHGGHTEGRRHYVSLGYTLAIGSGEADFIAN